MHRKPIREYREFGLEFYVYLEKTGKKNIQERRTLDQIYNGEFRNSRPGFPFSQVLYGLFWFGEVRVKKGKMIYFLEKINKLKWSQPTRADIADKNGIEIYSSDHQLKDGKISFKVDSSREHTEHLIIENTGSETVCFIDHVLLRRFANFSLKVEKKYPLDLPPGSIHKVEVKYTACAGGGVESAMLALEFERSSTSFHIVRFIEAKCKTTLGKKLSDSAPNWSYSRPTWTPPTKATIVDGQRPEEYITEKRQKHLLPLADYELPDDMNNLILALKNPGTFYDQRQKKLDAPLSINNYAEKLHLLLHLEEYQLERKIRRYNIPNDNQQEVTMERDRELLVLKITAENRPSLRRGDQLLAYPVGETFEEILCLKKYCGYVHIQNPNFVKLGFNKELLNIFVEGMKFHIEFKLNRLNLRTQHRAAEFAVRNKLAPVLLPEAPPSSAPPQTLPDLKLSEINPEQYRAVQHIVAGSSKPAPYLVFGPPGTGKTVTLVKAIEQIMKCQPQSCILACASTNKAADHFCESLLKTVDKSKVLRIYAKSYNPQDVPENLKVCSKLVGNYLEFPKDIQDLKSVNITTLLTSSRFVTDRFPQGHFTHVFVDNAGAAQETECLLPLAGLLNPETGQVVLAGDPKQLDPIIESLFARRFGMGLSLLERLMTDFPLYQKTNGMFDNRFVTKLLHNYRSHPAILKIPNELFYDGELQVFANEDQRNSCCFFELLPQKDFPIIFHGMTNESSSRSLFNMAEVEVLMGYVKKLLQSNVTPRDIGIIVPYGKQVKEIHKALEKVKKDYEIKDMSSLEVGTVEQFQGQEKRVILVSTVGSSLLFFKNDKWFNVAVTRAIALLIIVGNPSVLSSDRTWARFINYCKEEGGYKS